MTKGGEAHPDKDRRNKEEVEVRNRADSLVYSVEKMLKENREKIADADAKNIESALEEAKNALKENDLTRINSAVDHLTTASHKLAEAMYKQATPGGDAGAASQAGAASAGQGDASQGKSKEGEVIDAEVVDSDDRKKPN